MSSAASGACTSKSSRLRRSASTEFWIYANSPIRSASDPSAFLDRLGGSSGATGRGDQRGCAALIDFQKQNAALDQGLEPPSTQPSGPHPRLPAKAPPAPRPIPIPRSPFRSEERRVEKECRYRWSPY